MFSTPLNVALEGNLIVTEELLTTYFVPTMIPFLWETHQYTT